MKRGEDSDDSRRRRKSRRSGSGAPTLMPPPGGVTVRMYRIGHGDCFLLAFSGDAEDRPVYVLIDCGYKPGSPKLHRTTTTSKDITPEHPRRRPAATSTSPSSPTSIRTTSTASRPPISRACTIGETWLAWTEDPNDDLANELREKFKDQLLGLIAARNRLAAAGDADQAREDRRFPRVRARRRRRGLRSGRRMLGAAGGDPANSMNKQVDEAVQGSGGAGRAATFVRTRRSSRSPAPPICACSRSGRRATPSCSATLDPQGDEEFRQHASRGRFGRQLSRRGSRRQEHGAVCKPI